MFDSDVVTLVVSNASSSVRPLVRKISIALSRSCHQRLWTSFISSYVQEKEAGSVSPWGLWRENTLSTSKTHVCLITSIRGGMTKLMSRLAHPCLYYYLLSPPYTALHILFHCTPYFYLNLYLYIFSCVMFLFFFALSIERTCPDLHFTTDYILYNWVCDE